MQIGDRIHRVGDAYVSFYVIEDGGHLTVVDAGLPGYWDDLDQLIRRNGWSVNDIEAILSPTPIRITSASPNDSARRPTPP